MALAEETLANLTRSPAKISRLKVLRQKAAKMYWMQGDLAEAFELYTRTDTQPELIYTLYDTLSDSCNTKFSVASLPDDKKREYHMALLQLISNVCNSGTRFLISSLAANLTFSLTHTRPTAQHWRGNIQRADRGVGRMVWLNINA
eukprot:sb/3473882/